MKGIKNISVQMNEMGDISVHMKSINLYNFI